MEILQPYNNTTLQLISDEAQYQFNSNELIDGVIKLSVFSDVGSYLDGEDLQQDIDFYVKNDDLFIKPNEKKHYITTLSSNFIFFLHPV